MKKLFAMLAIILMLFVVSFGETAPVNPPVAPNIIATDATSEINSGLYWGVTLKKSLEVKNSVLEAGWIYSVGKGMFLAGGLEYENTLSTWGPNCYVFKQLRPRLYGLAGVGASFYETKFNNTGSLTVGFAYSPDVKLLGSIDLVVIPRYQYVGYLGTTDAAEIGNKPAIVDNKASEVWLSIIFIGW